jgi:hypothetical protein
MPGEAARLEGHGGRGEGERDPWQLARVDRSRPVEGNPDEDAGAAIGAGGRTGEDPHPVGWVDGQVLRQAKAPGNDLGPVAVREGELPPAPQRSSAPVLAVGASGAQHQEEDREERQLMKRS